MSQLSLIQNSFFFLLSVDLKKGPCPNAAKSNLPKPCQTGLRPPTYSRLPAAKLAAFGFVRSSSVSSVSSNQSNDSAQSDQSRTTNRKSKKWPSFAGRGYKIDVLRDCPDCSLHTRTKSLQNSLICSVPLRCGFGILISQSNSIKYY